MERIRQNQYSLVLNLNIKKLNIKYGDIQVKQYSKVKYLRCLMFERLNWLPETYRFKQCVNSMVFKYFNEQCPNYLNEVFDVATESNFQLRSSFQKLKCPFWKTNNGQNALSYIGSTLWNQTPHTLRRSNNLNTFKHNFKKYYLEGA